VFSGLLQYRSKIFQLFLPPWWHVGWQIFYVNSALICHSIRVFATRISRSRIRDSDAKKMGCAVRNALRSPRRHCWSCPLHYTVYSFCHPPECGCDSPVLLFCHRVIALDFVLYW
jgi:hypothetical protein